MIAEMSPFVGLVKSLTSMIGVSMQQSVLLAIHDPQIEAVMPDEPAWLGFDPSHIALRQDTMVVRMFTPLQPSEIKRTGYNRLVAELLSYKKMQIDRTPEERLAVLSAIDHTIALVDAIPDHLPLPKPMLLSEQAAVYWELHDAYAEIDVDCHGMLSAYGKRVGHRDVLIDLFTLRSSTGRVAFPSALEAIIAPREALTPA